MNGLTEMFSALCKAGAEPDQNVVPLLLARAQQHNYVPPAAEAAYGAALLREYRQFCQGRSVDYGTWRGHPRESIPWYPSVNLGRCDGCGACLRFCPTGVFASKGDGEIHVIEPYRCQVGCDACVQVCKPGAIRFPSQDLLSAFSR
jgi:NAD-dependent dihydropyrimidine dehydrogenase PreA subunit